MEERAIIREVARRYPRATLTGPAAARVWGLATLGWVSCVDLIPPGKTRAKTKGTPGIVYRHGKVPGERVQTIRGVRVAPIIVVLFDVYRYYGRLACLVALESARHRSPNLTQEKLLECARDLPRAKGLRGFRQVIRESVTLSENALETVVRDIVCGIEGVTTLEAQVRFSYVSEYGERCTGKN